MELPDSVHCVFSARLDERAGSYFLQVPAQEIQVGGLQAGETYRVAVLPSSAANTADDTDAESQPDPGLQPPVEDGERRIVEIENIGDQGDGIAYVDRGFVVIVPDTEQGERVTVEITEVRDNVAFAEIVERLN